MFDAPEKTKIKELLYALQMAAQNWQAWTGEEGEEQLAPLDPACLRTYNQWINVPLILLLKFTRFIVINGD